MLVQLLCVNPNLSRHEILISLDCKQKTALLRECSRSYSACCIYRSSPRIMHIIWRTSLLRRWIAEGLIAERISDALVLMVFCAHVRSTSRKIYGDNLWDRACGLVGDDLTLFKICGSFYFSQIIGRRHNGPLFSCQMGRSRTSFGPKHTATKCSESSTPQRTPSAVLGS
jgi:hypothetical protein